MAFPPVTITVSSTWTKPLGLQRLVDETNPVIGSLGQHQDYMQLVEADYTRIVGAVITSARQLSADGTKRAVGLFLGLIIGMVLGGLNAYLLETIHFEKLISLSAIAGAVIGALIATNLDRRRLHRDYYKERLAELVARHGITLDFLESVLSQIDTSDSAIRVAIRDLRSQPATVA